MTRIDDSQMRALLSVVEASLGLRIPESRLPEAQRILERRLEASGHDPARYLRHLTSVDAAAELRALARELTVSETYFFRDVDQMRALTGAALPALRDRWGPARELRILSAGCSIGAEAHGIAIEILETPALEGSRVRILGIDINREVLDEARAAVYRPWALRATPDAVKDRYFRRTGDRYQLADAVRARVTFQEGNLSRDADPVWEQGPFHVIFCRNVLIYFSPETVRAVIDRCARALAPDGYLFLGHAETLRGMACPFELCHTHGTFYYRRLAEPVAAPASRSPVSAPPARPGSTADAEAVWSDRITRSTDLIARMAASPSSRGSRSPSSGRPDDRVPPPAAGIPDVLDRSRQAIAAGRYGDAVDLLHGHADGSPAARLLLAVARTHQGALVDLLPVLEQLRVTDEFNPVVYYLFGLWHEAAGDGASAVRMAETAVYLDPTFGLAHFLLGRLARRLSRTALARTSLRQARELLPFEDPDRFSLLAGGFTREQLVSFCDAERAPHRSEHGA